LLSHKGRWIFTWRYRSSWQTKR